MMLMQAKDTTMEPHAAEPKWIIENPHLCKAKLEPDSQKSIEALLDSIEVVRCIGGGASGKVYQARQRGAEYHQPHLSKVHRELAVKLVPKPPPLCSPRGHRRLNRAREEARIMAALTSALEEQEQEEDLHYSSAEYLQVGQTSTTTTSATPEKQPSALSYVCRCYGALETSKYVCMLLEYCTGGDLFDLLNNGGPLKEAKARRLFVELARAVGELHDRGIVHRDIKPENILLDARGHLRLADFGFARKFDPLGVSLIEDEFVGTLHYASPEIVARRPYVGPEVDVWACGAGSSPSPSPSSIDSLFSTPEHHLVVVVVVVRTQLCLLLVPVALILILSFFLSFFLVCLSVCVCVCAGGQCCWPC